jgi:hypothetical protein
MILTMADIPDLEARVAAAFAERARLLEQWPDPCPDPALIPDDAYERQTNPAKWRILGARATAWVSVLANAGLATVDPDAAVTWRQPPLTNISRAHRLTPHAPGALDLVIGHSSIGDIDDAGVTLGVGNPTELLTWIPACGCDACDGGSQPELDRLDDCIRGVVTGSIGRTTDGQLEVFDQPYAESPPGGTEGCVPSWV